MPNRCPGCSLHISSYAEVKKSKRKYRYSCIASYNALTAICFVDIIKRGDNYLLRPSLVELQQKATKQYDLVNAPIVTPIPSTTLVDSSLTDVVLKCIPTPVTRNQLRQLKQDFKFARTLEFYTDGSMMAHCTDQCVMDIGWIQVDTDNDIPSRTFSAQVQLFPSALRAEIYAVLSALCTAPKFCVVTIVTDNKNVKVGLRHICSQISSTPLHLKDLFASNAILWAAIAYIIDTQELMCSIRKIKSHSSNSYSDPAQLHNDTADQLAKAGTMKLLFSFDTSFLSNSQCILSWSAIEVDLPTHKFVKQLCEAKSFNTVYTSLVNKNSNI